jgi:hypothetical protein
MRDEIETDEGFTLEELRQAFGRLAWQALGCVHHGDVLPRSGPLTAATAATTVAVAVYCGDRGVDRGRLVAVAVTLWRLG